MTGQAEVGATEQRVLAVLQPDPMTADDVAARLDVSLSTVHGAVVRLVEAGWAEVADGRVGLTPAGRERAGREPAGTEAPPVDAEEALREVVDVARSVGSAWVARAERAEAERAAADEALLASDEDRDRTVHRLAEAFSQGRLSSTELDERTGRALAARTRGDIDDVLTGLGGLAVLLPPRPHRPGRAVVFWVVSVLMSPFLLLGTLFVLFGDDLGDHLFGIVFLALTSPPLLALWRWSRR